MNNNEKYRAECEARYWLEKGYTTKANINDLRDQIAKKRGVKAAMLLKTAENRYLVLNGGLVEIIYLLVM